MLTSTLHSIGAGIYVLAYGTATLYANLTDAHRDMCPVYAMITLGALLHLIVAIAQHGAVPGGRAERSDRAPITNAQRITYFDHDGNPYYTEWVRLPDSAKITAEAAPALEPKLDEGARTAGKAA